MTGVSPHCLHLQKTIVVEKVVLQSCCVAATEVDGRNESNDDLQTSVDMQNHRF